MSVSSVKLVFTLALCLLCGQLLAHNGSIAYAYPLGKIKVDGDLSDWPKDAAKYLITIQPSNTKPQNDADFSGYFQVGYNLANRSLYLAFTITDDDFVEDTSRNVQWNTQDGLEISLDGRHLLNGSGVASFMCSKTLHTINNALYDPFASKANWDMVDVAVARHGNTRTYEWRIQLGKELQVGKSIGFDFHVYDKDSDGSFSWSAWGKGLAKYRNPNSLGDVIFLPANEKMATISGNISWDKPKTAKFPELIRLIALDNPTQWLTTEVDSLGNYTVMAPAGKYKVSLADAYYISGGNVYPTAQKLSVVVARAGQKITAPAFSIAATPVPDLIPEKGVLLDYTAATPAQIDHFIETYQEYYGIPGVSLAIIKDGKVLYHKTYGVTNTMTGQKVNDSTLFEAASVTKPVFAFAVERLAERGVIDLDRPLYEYLPYPDIAYDDRYKLMTARHVLTHRTGFPNWRTMNPDGKLDLKFTPGTAYNYSGEGFEYLKKVIEKITGKKVEQVLQEEVIGPVGLAHTYFSKNDTLMRVAATGHYDKVPSNKWMPEFPVMASSMHTEAKIFTRFMIYLLEQKGLKPATYDTILTKHSDYPADASPQKLKVPTYMGMSLEIRETRWGKTFGHGGNNGDFTCRFEVYKDLKMGYAIFTNSNTSPVLLENLHKFLVEGKDEGQ